MTCLRLKTVVSNQILQTKFSIKQKSSGKQTSKFEVEKTTTFHTNTDTFFA